MTLEKPGDSYKGFRVTRIVPLPEIGCLLKELVHLPTGAPVIHIENDDPENVFCLSFRTLPDSSNGVAHILEHTVLCGSQKYPVKDPFFAMNRRSLNTFMNAFTGSDFTCYPAASQIKKDFYNLLDVYLDAVFHPLLQEQSFRQEGHRLEFATLDQSDTPLEFKGVVYNEMKGAMATPDSRLGEAFDAALFPSLTYRFNSGGDPKSIPQLTYQELLKFHQEYYHPSRCLFYFYGDLPLEGHLDFIEKHALAGQIKKETIPLLPKQPRFSHPKKEETSFPFAAEEDPKEKAMIAFGWLTCGILEQEELLALSVISIALLDTDASPLKMALLKSGLCKQVFAHLGDDYSEIPLSITLRGCSPENGEKLERIVKDTLKSIVREGLSEELVENALHQVEFHRCEISGDNLPYGLVLFMRAGLLKQHGGDPESALLVHSLCQGLRDKLKKEPRTLESLIENHLISNPHFIQVIARPDQKLAQQEAEEEQALLDQIQATLDAKKREALVEQAKELERFQQEQENADFSVLPTVTLSDVPKNSRNYPLEVEQVEKLAVYRHSCFTNGIIYADLIFPLPHIKEKELPFLRLFSLLLPQVGAGGRTYAENLAFIQAHTGGVGSSHSLNTQVDSPDRFFPCFVVQGKALFRNRQKLFQLLRDLVESPDFTDQARLKEVLTKHVTALESTLNQNALRYAMSLAASSLGIAPRIGNAWGGLEYYYAVKELTSHFDEKASSFIELMQDLKERLLCLESPHLILSSDEKSYKDMAKNRFYGLGEIPAKSYTPWRSDYTLPLVEPQGRSIPSPVAFVCQALKTVPYLHPDTPALGLAAKLFDNLVLHPQIREKGGAYGSGAGNNPFSGTFTFYSYRDPHIASTFATFQQAIEQIMSKQFDNSDLEEAKLEIVQALDTPVTPGSRAHAAYFWLREGKTSEIRQAYRNRLLSATCADVSHAVGMHIRPAFQKSVPIVFASQELLEKENALLRSEGRSPLKILKI